MNSENLKNFQPGNDARRNVNGRPKKFISQFVLSGYRRGEINDCIVALLSLTIDDLEHIAIDKQATALEASIASALLQSYRKGDLNAIETVLSRRFGKAKEIHEVTVTPELTAGRNLFFRLIHQEKLDEKEAMQIVLTSAENNGFTLNPDAILDVNSFE